MLNDLNIFFYFFHRSTRSISIKKLFIGYRLHPFFTQSWADAKFDFHQCLFVQSWTMTWIKGSKNRLCINIIKCSDTYLNSVTRWRQMMKFMPNKEDFFSKNRNSFAFAPYGIRASVSSADSQLVWSKKNMRLEKYAFIIIFYCLWENDSK